MIMPDRLHLKLNVIVYNNDYQPNVAMKYEKLIPNDI